MRIRIIKSEPTGSQKSVEHLICKEFDVLESDSDGHYIGYGETGLYFINNGEFEII